MFNRWKIALNENKEKARFILSAYLSKEHPETKEIIIGNRCLAIQGLMVEKGSSRVSRLRTAPVDRSGDLTSLVGISATSEPTYADGRLTFVNYRLITRNEEELEKEIKAIRAELPSEPKVALTLEQIAELAAPTRKLGNSGSQNKKGKTGNSHRKGSSSTVVSNRQNDMQTELLKKYLTSVEVYNADGILRWPSEKGLEYLTEIKVYSDPAIACQALGQLKNYAAIRRYLGQVALPLAFITARRLDSLTLGLFRSEGVLVLYSDSKYELCEAE